METDAGKRHMPQQSNTPRSSSQPPSSPVGYGLLEARGVGPLWLAWVPEGLAMLRFGAEPPEEEVRRWFPEVSDAARQAVPPSVRDLLTRYFDGEDVDPADLPVRLGGTAFQRRAWTALRRVPRGQVRTYGGLAKDVRSPRAMRAIGVAMAQNPIAIVVPCHRIVGAGMALGGYSGGLGRKRLLLELEGVKLEGDRVLPGQLELL